MRYNDVVEDVGYAAAMRTQSGIAGQIPNQQSLNSPKRPPELQVSTATLNERVGVLMKALSDLVNRLEPAMRPAPPSSPSTATNQASNGYGAATHLGQAIAGATSNIDVVINGVRDLLDRLEL